MTLPVEGVFFNEETQVFRQKCLYYTNPYEFALEWDLLYFVEMYTPKLDGVGSVDNRSSTNKKGGPKQL